MVTTLTVIRNVEPIALMASPASAQATLCTAADTASFLVNVTLSGGGPAANESMVVYGAAACQTHAASPDARSAMFSCSRPGSAGDGVAQFFVNSSDGGCWQRW